MWEIRELCREAYDEDLSDTLEQLTPAVHVLGWLDSVLVAHALWVTRWLQAGDAPLLKTAYVEAVATKASERRRGFASQLLARLARELGEYDLAALSPSDAAFYAKLGWEAWRGPLFIRKDAGLAATPDDSVMILRLARTPVGLNVTEPLSAEWREGELW